MKKTVTASNALKAEGSDTLSQVTLKREYALMLELIGKGIYRTTNLAKALHVSLDSITAWKKTPEAEDAHRKAILKFADKRVDVENILKELGMEIDTTEVPLINVTINQWSDEQLAKFIESEATRRVASRSVVGDETQGAIEPVEVLEVS